MSQLKLYIFIGNYHISMYQDSFYQTMLHIDAEYSSLAGLKLSEKAKKVGAAGDLLWQMVLHWAPIGAKESGKFCFK